jgi:hypothetical protein
VRSPTRSSPVAGWIRVVLLVAACTGAPATSAPISPTPALAPAPGLSPVPTTSSSPYWPAQDWRVSTPEEQGIDSAGLLEMLGHIQARRYPIHGIAVVRNGYLVMEVHER